MKLRAINQIIKGNSAIQPGEVFDEKDPKEIAFYKEAGAAVEHVEPKVVEAKPAAGGKAGEKDPLDK